APRRPPQTRIDEELAGIVAEFAMDIHGWCVIGCFAVVQPKGIGEPRIRFGQRHQLPCPFVVDPYLCLPHWPQDTPHALDALDQISDSGGIFRVSHVDMCQLVVADGKGSTAKSVERLTKWPQADDQEPCLTKLPVEIDRLADRNVAVFIDHPDAGTHRL